VRLGRNAMNTAITNKIPPPPKPGEIVRVRSRRYLVENVAAPPRPGDAALVSMACLDDDAQGQPLKVLWEKEIDPEILTGEAWQDLATRGFDPPRLFSAYLHTLRWNCVTATDPRLFQSPFRAGIQIHAYQLEPLRKALLLPRVNLFIADDVGLGKTIEAGLIAREMLLRNRIRDIVVSCPPSMLLQWKDELETRFGLTFEVLDKAYIARIRQERGYSVNPWGTHTRFLVSQRLLIDESYAGPMRDWLGELRPGSLLILDEAHNAAPASGARYAIDSKITRAIRDLAPRFEHRLFLSATPHNGHSNSFSALLEILDPQRFCRGVPVRGRKLLEDVMVRRLKEDIRTVVGGLPQRIVRQVDIDGLSPDAPELKLSEMLDEYRNLRRERLKGETKHKQASAELLVCGLQQRRGLRFHLLHTELRQKMLRGPRRTGSQLRLGRSNRGVSCPVPTGISQRSRRLRHHIKPSGGGY
jgi:SNF2 family DNA or RNA helicase